MNIRETFELGCEVVSLALVISSLFTIVVLANVILWG
jgi:hypothetical protein